MALCLASPLVGGCPACTHCTLHSQLLRLSVGKDCAHDGNGQATTIHQGYVRAGRRRGLWLAIAIALVFGSASASAVGGGYAV